MVDTGQADRRLTWKSHFMLQHLHDSLHAEQRVRAKYLDACILATVSGSFPLFLLSAVSSYWTYCMQ